MRSASEFRQMARETLRGNWKLAMGTGLAASLIGAEIADTAPNGITELQKVIQARPEVKNVLTQVFLMRSMLLPLMLLLIWGLMVVIIGGAGQMGYARFHLNLAEKKEASFSDLFSQFSRITDGVAMVFVRGFYIYCWTCLFFVPGFHKDVQLCDDTICADGTSRIFRQRGDHRVAPPDGWEKMEFILPDL